MNPGDDELQDERIDTPDDETACALMDALTTLERNKPNDRTRKDRYYAVTMTQLEMALAYFQFNVVFTPFADLDEPEGTE